jgi:bifunctional DNA-binding transcriptional regulator/antitoxin component of YhaV-PrlF toxin-antitoxin module
MKSRTVTLSSKNQITLPSEARWELAVGPHDRVTFVIADGTVQVIRAEDELSIDDIAGSVPPLQRPVSEDLDEEIHEAQVEMANRLQRSARSA